MTGTTLRQRLDATAALQAVAGARGGGVVAGVPAAAAGLVAWWLRERLGRTVLLIGDDAVRLFTDSVVWGGESGVALFPDADTLSFDRVAPGEEVTRRRIGTLAALRDGGPLLVVASAEGLLRPTLPVDVLRGGILTLQPGQKVDRDGLVGQLIERGYRRESAVSSAGEFAVRGGIVDVFGLGRSRPWRAEWFGDEVEELRAFDVETQTSVAKLGSVDVWPARELNFSAGAVARAREAIDAFDLSTCRPEVREQWERDRARLEFGAYDDGGDLFAPYLGLPEPASLLDHLDNPVVVLAGGADRVWRTARRHIAEVEKLRRQEEERGELPAGALSGLLDLGVVRARLECWDAFELVREAVAGDAIADLEWRGVEEYAGRLEAMVEAVRGRAGEGVVSLLLTRQQGRVEELLGEHGLHVADAADFDAGATPVTSGASVAGFGDLSAGFTTGAAGVDIYTDHELFGLTKRRGSPLARGARKALSTSARGARSASSGKPSQAFVIQFKPGDVVVHRDHGIGRFVDMRRVSGDEGEHEYMTLEYAEGAKLFVPVDHLDRVDRYIGGSEANPSLSKLGTSEWDRTKRRVKERTEGVARELIGMYSRRQMAQGHAYQPDGTWQHELEGSFPFQETPDQEMVLEEIKRDMESSRPMDRVVCGDVGFGKTELALRAAFKAITEGRQVALLVPTTVLAQQHFLTFAGRLSAFPITVRQLSRFCSEHEIQETLRGLVSGGVDIVIGTHRLLQKDVKFNNLGLVIVDEEQRFGVMQKERFKELRVAVDMLSLSATPIPRTLHMALAGIRDLSVIQTPPEERQPIKTYVTAREEGLIREVLLRELSRNGQAFFLHNRVQTIEGEAQRLRELVPEVRIAVGHGQMPEHHLAAVMGSFSAGEVDVLVCTTIIESGLDIPNANTIIVNDAHRFGLAQLYQLRGRVGRSGQRAYAYMLYPADRSLTERADKRLDVITDLQDLGAGFKLAMRDLEIRGAGNLLGEEQHGEIAAVGLELYNTMLGQAVGELQGKPVQESPSQVAVSLPLHAYLPPAYVADERLRLRCYQDLASAVSEAELEKRGRGLVDRFGPLPGPAEDLVYSLRARLLAAACGATAVEGEQGSIQIQLPAGHGLDLDSVARQFRTTMSASPTRLRLMIPDLVAPRNTRKDVRIVAGVTAEWKATLLAALRELGRLSRVRQAQVVST